MLRFSNCSLLAILLAIAIAATPSSQAQPVQPLMPPPGQNAAAADEPLPNRQLAPQKPVAAEPAEDTPTNDKPSDDKPSDDKPTDDKPTDDKPARAASSPRTTPSLIATIPLPSTADRIDAIAEGNRHIAVIGLLEEQTVATIDLDSGQVLAQAAVGFAPNVVRYDAQRRLVYAAGANAPGLVVLDSETLQVKKAYGLGAGVLDITFDSQTGRIFATHPTLSSISVIDLTEKQARALPMPDPPLAVAFSERTGKLLVTLGSDDPLGLLVVDADSGELEARLRSGATPEAIALDDRRQRLVVLNSKSNDLSVLDLDNLDLGSEGTQVKTVGLNWRPTRLALSPSGDRAYVTSRDSDRLQVVNLNSGQLEATYTIGRQPIGIQVLSRQGAPSVVVVEAGVPQLQWLSLPSTSAISTVAPPPSSGSAAGRVVDLAGQLVSRGEIRLTSLRQDVPERQLNLLPDGSFLIPGLTPGLYLADISVPGYPTVSSQLQVRSGFVSSTRIQLPPGRPSQDATGMGIIPDANPFSDELAAHLRDSLQHRAANRDVELLIGPIGVWDKFRQLAPLAEGLTVIDRDNRLTNDLERLKVIGTSLGLRYVLLTHMEISRDFNRRGNPLINLAVRYFVPGLPLEIPNLTPNQLRSRGVMVVVDLLKDKPGDRARYYEAFGRDDVGGNPLFEDAAAGLFRRQAQNMIPNLLRQWQDNGAPLS